MPIEPVGDKLLIEDVEADEKKSKGGLLVPDSAQNEQQKTAKVIAIGSGKVLQNGDHVEWDCHPDDVIIYNQFAGNEVEDEDGKKFKLISQDDVWAIMTRG